MRIKFEDTSGSAAFPSNDWQITINDSANGGANFFAIDDIDSGKTPFKVEAGAPTGSVHVDNGGRVGFGTVTPATSIHATAGNTPTLRLEQDGSSGFTQQTWDIGGNEAGFFVRDQTNGSQLVFRVIPGAPKGSLRLGTAGVGIMTGTPTHALDVTALDANNGIAARFRGGAMVQGRVEVGPEPGGAGQVAHLFVTSNNRLNVGPDASTPVFSVDTVTGDATFNGVVEVDSISTLSSRATKENFSVVTPAAVLEQVLGLAISTWNYIDDARDTPHLGPMAEDFFAAFGLGGRSDRITIADMAGVALAAIQGLAARVEADAVELAKHTATIQALVRDNRLLAEKNAALEARVARLERLLLGSK